MHSSGLRLKAVTSPVDVNEFTFLQGMQAPGAWKQNRELPVQKAESASILLKLQI
jgi:hypothetical protein